jgi:hypothetical protein
LPGARCYRLSGIQCPRGTPASGDPQFTQRPAAWRPQSNPAPAPTVPQGWRRLLAVAATKSLPDDVAKPRELGVVGHRRAVGQVGHAASASWMESSQTRKAGSRARLQKLGCSTQPLGALNAIRRPGRLGGGDGEDFWLLQRPKVFALTWPTPARWELCGIGGARWLGGLAGRGFGCGWLRGRGLPGR